MRRACRVIPVALLVSCVLSLGSCVREARVFRPEPTAAEAVQWHRKSPLYPGSPDPVDADEETEHAVTLDHAGEGYWIENEYEENAYALAEGKRLFVAFNCNGCHGNGGGGMGPPLMDSQWRYGHQPEQVFATIVEGRPNGMPSFGGRIPAYQIWQLAGYVRSLSGQVRRDAAPGRNDDMKAKPPENSKDRETPVDSPLAGSAEAG